MLETGVFTAVVGPVSARVMPPLLSRGVAIKYNYLLKTNLLLALLKLWFVETDCTFGATIRKKRGSMMFSLNLETLLQ